MYHLVVEVSVVEVSVVEVLVVDVVVVLDVVVPVEVCVVGAVVVLLLLAKWSSTKITIAATPASKMIIPKTVPKIEHHLAFLRCLKTYG